MAGGAGGAALPDGGAGTLTGPTAFPIVATRSTTTSTDGGPRVDLFVAILYDHQPVTCATSPNPPFSSLLIRVRNPDGGVVSPGTWPIDGTSVKVTRDDFLTTGQGPDGGEALSGTVVITRLEAARSSGTFTAQMQFYSLSSGTLSGSWDAPVCP